MKRRIHALLLALALSVLPLTAASCGKSAVTDYSKKTGYTDFYTEDDDEATVNLKNVMIGMVEAYNAGNADAYYAPFDMTEEDLTFNKEMFTSMRAEYDMSYTLEDIVTAFADEAEENAQAMLTLRCTAVSKSDGSTLYDYRSEVTYTLVLDSGSWVIQSQEQGDEIDLTGEYVSPTQEAEGELSAALESAEG